MIRHALVTLAWVGLCIAALIVVAPKVDHARAADCREALTHALPSLQDRYFGLCVQGYAIEGVGGRAYQG